MFKKDMDIKIFFSHTDCGGAVLTMSTNGHIRLEAGDKGKVLNTVLAELWKS